MVNGDQCRTLPRFSVFEIGGRVVDSHEIFRAAGFAGVLEPCRKELVAGLAADGRARKRGLVPETRALQEMCDAFRYENDLITAEETERWLGRRGLTLDDFNEFFLRRYWNARLEENAERPAFGDLDRPLLIELVMSGVFDRMATSLSRRMAVAHASGPDHAPPASEVRQARTLFLDRLQLTEAAVPEWLARIGADEDWLEEMLQMDAVYSRRCDLLLDAPTRERTLQALRLPLTRIEVEVLDLESDDAAREAYLCVGQDGVAMNDLARECGHFYRRVDLLLDDLDEELGRVFLSAAPGEVLAPMESNGSFRLCRLVGKTEPTLDEATTLERVDKRILASYFDELTARHVRWRLGGGARE